MSAVQKDGPYAWFYLAVTALVCFLFIGLIDSSGIVVAVFIDRYNESNAKGGWVGSIVTFLMFGLAPMVVHIHRQFGFRWCMFISSVFYCLSFIITPFTPNINFVFLTYSIPLGISVAFVSTLTIITQQEYFNKYFGVAIGVRYGSGALGTVVISFILPFAFDGIGFKHTLLSMLVLIPFILCYGLASRHQVTVIHSYKTGKSTKKLYWEFLQDRSFILCIAGLALYMFASTMPHVLMVRYGITLGYPLSKAKWFLMVKSLMMIVATIVTGRVSDKTLRYGKVKLVSQIICVIFGILSLLCSFVTSFSLIMVYMALEGLLNGVWWAMYPICIVDITSGYHSNEAYGLANLVLAFSYLSGPPCGGWLFDITGDFRNVFYLIFVITIIAAILTAISSCVKVEKHLSLAEKSEAKKNHVLHNVMEEEISHCFLDDLQLVFAGPLIYETAV